MVMIFDATAVAIQDSRFICWINHEPCSLISLLAIISFYNLHYFQQDFPPRFLTCPMLLYPKRGNTGELMLVLRSGLDLMMSGHHVSSLHTGK